MKKIALYLFLSVSILILNGQTKQPNTIPEKQIPKAVLKKFKEKRPNATDVTWYPYPNQFGKDKSAVPSYFPIGWTGYSQEYYEVRFTGTVSTVREVYDRGGNWKITSRPIENAQLPDELNAQLTEKGYDSWTKVSTEKVSRVGQKGQFYKIWITQDKRKRILFFDESYKLVKTLKWDNDIKLMVNVNAQLKKAPTVKKQRRVIAADEVPDGVRSKVRKNHIDIEVLEWSVYSRAYDPFSTDEDFTYYDIAVPAFYQLIFSDNSSKFMATYDTTGDLIELAEILPTKKLTKAIRQLLVSDDYQSWKWENEHEKIEVEDGQVIYRVYGAENDTPNLLILNPDGTRIKS